jgi:hypothetical protein
VKPPTVINAREWNPRTKRRVLREVAAEMATEPSLTTLEQFMRCWYLARRMFVERVIRA